MNKEGEVFLIRFWIKWCGVRMPPVVENLWATGTWWTRLEANYFTLRAK